MTQHIAHTGTPTAGHTGAHLLDGNAQRLGFNYKLRRILTARSTLAVLLVSPLLVLIGGLILYPFGYAIYLSMQNKAETAFVGFRNFEFLFKRDTFWMVVQQSFVFALSAVFFKALIGFILAHVINVLPDKKQRLWRGLVLVPWVMPPALSTLAWWWLFDPSYSAINWLLTVVAGVSIPWLSDPFWARFSVILVNVWYGSPFFLIMYLAGLKSVPHDLYEAASIDGATTLQKMRYITIPMMRNIIAITVLFSTIVTFANFDIVRVLTNGGPRNMTDLFGTWAFKLGIGSGDIPLAAAVSLFLFPMLAVLAIFILRNVNKRTQEI